MSLETWKAEFYPVTAQIVAERGTKREIIQHSLTKWIGLRPENLEKHELIKLPDEREIFNPDEREYFEIDADSCSLCHAFIRDEVPLCSACPLYTTLGNLSCAGRVYSLFVETSDPEPMIAALKKTLEAETIKELGF